MHEDAYVVNSIVFVLAYLFFVLEFVGLYLRFKVYSLKGKVADPMPSPVFLLFSLELRLLRFCVSGCFCCGGVYWLVWSFSCLV